MADRLIQYIFVLSIMGLLLLGLVLAAKHFGFALFFSEYIFGLIVLGVFVYIYRLSK